MTTLLPRLAVALACTLIVPVHAKDWPTKPVPTVASFPPGTPGDMISRITWPALQVAWNQPVIVENKAGAGGNLAADEVAQARDDLTLLIGPETVLSINPHLYKKLASNPRTWLNPVTCVASLKQVLVCHPAAEITSLTQVAHLDASRMYASGAAGTPSRMAMGMLPPMIGTRRLTHVPYRGPGPAALDVIVRNVDCGFIGASAVLPHIQRGCLRAIAVPGKERSGTLPAVPTVAGNGHAGFGATFIETLMAPAGLPDRVVEKVQRDVRVALQAPAIKARLAEMDLRVADNTPQDARRRSQEEFTRWGAIAQRTGLQSD